MKVRLPDPVLLQCPDCSFRLQLSPQDLRPLHELNCPRCAGRQSTYFWLPARVRQGLSARIRSRLYFEAHQLNTRRRGGGAD